MLTVEAKGVFPIAPTPFLADGSIDEASVDRMAGGVLSCSGLAVSNSSPPRFTGLAEHVPKINRVLHH